MRDRDINMLDAFDQRLGFAAGDMTAEIAGKPFFKSFALPT